MMHFDGDPPLDVQLRNYLMMYFFSVIEIYEDLHKNQAEEQEVLVCSFLHVVILFLEQYQK